jgi:hypothetical protein
VASYRCTAVHNSFEHNHATIIPYHCDRTAWENSTICAAMCACEAKLSRRLCETSDCVSAAALRPAGSWDEARALNGDHTPISAFFSTLSPVAIFRRVSGQGKHHEGASADRAGEGEGRATPGVDPSAWSARHPHAAALH